MAPTSEKQGIKQRKWVRANGFCLLLQANLMFLGRLHKPNHRATTPEQYTEEKYNVMCMHADTDITTWLISLFVAKHTRKKPPVTKQKYSCRN